LAQEKLKSIMSTSQSAMRCLFLLLAHSVMSASAHFCLVSPKQRGELALAEAGEPACYRRTPYCGGVEPGPPTATYKAGALTSITFQQNLNHWYNANPGYMDIAIASGNNPANDAFTVLHTIPDFFGIEMVQQNNFTVQVRMPAEASPHSVVRVRYVSHAPTEVDPANNTQAIFYNCADVRLVAEAESVEGSSAQVVPDFSPDKAKDKIGALEVSQNSTMDCPAPQMFAAVFEENTTIGIVRHSVHWDAPNMRTRWQTLTIDKYGSLIENMTMYNDFNLTRNPDQNEFQIRDDGFCYRYGHGFFYHWEFGTTRHMRFVGIDEDFVRTWVSGDVNIGRMYHATLRVDQTCIPSGWAHTTTNADGTTHVNTVNMVSFKEVGLFDEGIFVPSTLESTDAAKKDHRGCERKLGMARVGCGHGPRAADIIV